MSWHSSVASERLEGRHRSNLNSIARISVLSGIACSYNFQVTLRESKRAKDAGSRLLTPLTYTSEYGRNRPRAWSFLFCRTRLGRRRYWSGSYLDHACTPKLLRLTLPSALRLILVRHRYFESGCKDYRWLRSLR